METQALRADLAAATEQIHVLVGALDEMKTEFRLYKLRPGNFASRLQQLYLSGEPAVPQRTRPSARRTVPEEEKKGAVKKARARVGARAMGSNRPNPAVQAAATLPCDGTYLPPPSPVPRVPLTPLPPSAPHAVGN